MTSKSTWTATSLSTLLASMRQSRNAGLMSDNGWKAPTWTAAAEKLSGSESADGGVAKSADACSSRWTSLKKDFIIVRTLRGLSGFGWDDERKVVTAELEVWEPYLLKNPRAAIWKKKPFPFYDEVADLAADHFATGVNAFAPAVAVAKDPAPGVDSSSDDDSGSQLPTRISNTTVSRRKRARSLSPTPPPVKKPRSRHRNSQAAGAVNEFTDAFRDFTSTIAGSSSDATLTSPVRRSCAIKAIQKADILSPHSLIKVIRHIQKPQNTYIADTFMALEAKNQAAYLEAELEDL